MSVVIIGGNERMVCQYTDICKDYGCKAKVFPNDPLYEQRIPQDGDHRFPGSKEKQYSDCKNPYQQCNRTPLGIR